MNEHDTDLADRLHHLAADIAVPSTDARDDLVRGRRRARRRTALIAGGATVACGAALTIGVGMTHSGDRGAQKALDPAVRSTDAPSVVAPSTPAQPALHDDECPAGKISTRVGLAGRAHTLTALLGGYATTLAAHLDPQGGHLQASPTNIQSSDTGGLHECLRPDQLIGIGTKLDWHVAGDRGLGVVEIEVTRAKPSDQQIRSGVSGWRPAEAPAGTVRAWTAGSGTDLAAEVERADGTYVAVATSGLFGNNSTVALSGGTGLTAAQLLAAAADPGYALPGA